MSERFLLDDAGEVIDLQTHQFVDYGKEIVDLLNELDEKYVDEFSLRETLEQDLQRVEEENEQLKKDKDDLIDYIKKEFPKSYKHILEGFE